MIRQATLLVAFAAFLLVGLVLPSAARAQSQSAQVELILASNESAGFDPGLEVHAGRLAAQFAGFSHFALLSSQNVQLAPSATVAAPGGEITLTALGEGQIQIAIPGVPPTTIGVPAGSVHFQLGPVVPGGTLIIAVRPG